jgi:hypothetical protein
MIQSARVRGVLSPVLTPFEADLSPDKQQFISLVFASILGAIAGLLHRRRPLPYERIEKLFSSAERSFFGVLEQICVKDFQIAHAQLRGTGFG